MRCIKASKDSSLLYLWIMCSKNGPSLPLGWKLCGVSESQVFSSLCLVYRNCSHVWRGHILVHDDLRRFFYSWLYYPLLHRRYYISWSVLWTHPSYIHASLLCAHKLDYLGIQLHQSRKYFWCWTLKELRTNFWLCKMGLGTSNICFG